jgi:hypothetical protein
MFCLHVHPGISLSGIYVVTAQPFFDNVTALMVGSGLACRTEKGDEKGDVVAWTTYANLIKEVSFYLIATKNFLYLVVSLFRPHLNKLF